ncbi:MAG: hypothetical protein F4Z85_18395 [Gemmatimonadetes bacterium]|nr:hypothetical protein [Gemmatimonadota bacterium]MYB67107.1 hypothetical protein [Gemmatimonadota bacterium]
MATFNGGRMVALSVCLLFANASFAQDGWVTVAVYMPDPIVEQMAPEVEAYIEKWLDPLTWETFERDFTPAREAQLAQVEAENEARIQAAEAFLRADLVRRKDGTSTWYPAWIPLALAKGDKEEGVPTDSLFKNILKIEGPTFSAEPFRVGKPQTLREFFERDGEEPDGLNADGSQKFRSCILGRERCRKNEFANFADLVDFHENPEVNVISFTVRARRSEGGALPPGEDPTFAGELDGGDSTKPVEGGVTLPSAEFDYDSIRLLQPAEHDPDEYVIDISPYWTPAAKPAASAEASSWGRIKATFADN